MLERSSIVKPNPYPLKHQLYLKRGDRQYVSKPRKGMTLIAGIRCRDGFLIAADTAVTRNDTVYHGEKVFWWRGSSEKPYKLVIAGAGYLAYAQMASQEIRDEVDAIAGELTIAGVKKAIKATVEKIWISHRWPYVQHQLPNEPVYDLIIGIEINGQYAVMATNGHAVHEVSTYSVEGSGAELAAYLSQVFLVSPQNQTTVSSTAVGVHLAIEIFRIAKQFGSAVGLDTQILAWRSADSYQPFTQPRLNQPANSDLGAVQENLKSALWEAFEKSAAPPVMFESKLKQIEQLLWTIKNHSNGQADWAARFVRYYLSRDGSWGMADLEPSAGLPSPSSPTEQEPRP